MRSFKIFCLILTAILHTTFATLGRLVFFFNKRIRTLYLAGNNKFICTLLCAILGVHVKAYKRESRYRKAVFYVGNHLTYLDAVILASLYPSVFVTSVDMGQRKSEGFILSNAGSVMVERRREKLTHGEIRQNIKNIQSVIMQGCPLCIFPEATSAGGGEELVFYSSMFASVEYTDTTIVPFHISYTKANREPLTESTRDTIYFYKGDHLLPHLNKLLNLNNIEAKITFLPDFSAKGKNRKEIRSDCKAIITEEINQQPRPEGTGY